jgi:hypothetical protein
MISRIVDTSFQVWPATSAGKQLIRWKEEISVHLTRRDAGHRPLLPKFLILLLESGAVRPRTAFFHYPRNPVFLKASWGRKSGEPKHAAFVFVA